MLDHGEADEEQHGLEMTPSGPKDDEEEESSHLLGLSDAPRDLTAASATFRNFIVMSVLFSAVPASSLACLALATARLGSTGAWQSGILYLTYTASAVAGATYVVKRLGSRNAMITGMTLVCLYVACFWLATWQPSMAKHFAWTGAGLGGIGSGFLWTSQGVYFSQAAEAYSLESGMDWAASNSLLAGIFAFILLTEETIMDILSTVLIRVFGISWVAIFAFYAIVAIAATMSMTWVRKYPREQDNQASFMDNLHKVTVAFQLLVRDSKMKYMIGFNAAFGFAGAFLNSFVSGEVVPVALGDSTSSYVGLFVAIHGASAALASLFFGRLAQYTGKGLVLVIGAAAFACVALPFLIQPNLQAWNWKLLVLVYAVEGVGRATFEGTLKATFADYFSYEKEGAFANIILQNGLSGAIAYILSFRLSCVKPTTYCIRYRDGSLHDMLAFGSLVVGISFAAIIGYWRASCLFHSGIGNQSLEEYRRKSIASYRTSRASLILDRATYQSLQTAVEADDVHELPEVS